jgi:hypothetical protein
MPVRLYVEIGPLDPWLHPAFVTRDLGVTMLAIDDCASRMSVAMFVADELTPDEQTVLRAAYGCPPHGHTFDSEWLEGTVDPVVPDPVALPWLRSSARRDAA